ncbi:hypothetical protein FHT87_004589 [Rhizobium sp. BK316]|uniref:hypothetical protein n=1 Tax=Rhizobium sp. BK316 TaxID=2587053 RepID=UPI001615C0A4|nr:hypothetical protein [Rhizobium sp. BK316]MBB3410657.1 hypothetical protein [Rhizobium sp. BK316]
MSTHERPVGPELPPEITIAEMETWLDHTAEEIVALKEEGYKLVPWFEWLEGQIQKRRNEQAAMDRVKARITGKAATSAVTLDDMTPHDVVLERYPWLTAQILNRWRRERRIRSFRGREGVVVYSRSELDVALEAEFRFDGSPEPRMRRPPSEPERPTMSEGDRIRERLYLERISGKRRPGKPKPENA